MIVTLSSGKQVRFVGGGRGLENAAYDFNSGDIGSKENPNHLHVYASIGFKTWLCSGEPLTVSEIYEAVGQAEIDDEELKAEKQALLQRLLTKEGEALIAERQQGNSDKQTASTDICQALDLWQPYKQNASWAVVKATRELKIRNLESDDKDKKRTA
jgi:hypothetical protein